MNNILLIFLIVFLVVGFVMGVAALTIKLNDIIEDAAENHRKMNE